MKTIKKIDKKEIINLLLLNIIEYIEDKEQIKDDILKIMYVNLTSLNQIKNNNEVLMSYFYKLQKKYGDSK